MDDDILEEISKYYKLKRNYEEKIEKNKNKIKRIEGISNNEKKRRIISLKKKCINCNRDGGTIFNITNKTLEAKCGNVEPCDLNININKKSYDNVINLYNLSKDKITNDKYKIIIIKLNLLFGYIEEIDAINEFEKINNTMSENIESFNIINLKYLNLINNTEDNDRLKILNDKLNENIINLKLLSESYQLNKDQSLIKESIDIYINLIIPLLKKIREVKYEDISFVEEYGNINMIMNEFKNINYEIKL